ncbi:phosphonate transport system substrate-binding protein [Paenibacillus cellulosilyticus]|uniref:Phosphonate transport system substrate-binding protein n=1 Tax=Paenibacillus cellulosilyticus TaxID=375489 RepID=A0A2V2YVD9_9BACL|nr:PhnD/SsuA/transferrin family substrate-binding protein [Paenibacillus cellulosilyticus]PWW05192.1 phosphonate transport system substrate-binding protein [Paenibacillus cellulosilyticus]QKS43517.1 PhnD/SsuA/transferrin family substrate-binding protein [Paenibacillus cellulosilyticus]
MKNKLVLFVVFTLLIGLLAGCGSDKKDEKTDTAANSTTTTDNSSTDTKAATTDANASTDTASTTDASKQISELKVSFVPSKDPSEIITATDPLKDLLKNQLATEGYTVDKVTIDVGTTYEAVGEAMTSGSTDIGFIPGGTYALYSDGADVILTATRAGLSNDSDNPKDWNDNKPTKATENQATYYRALFIAGPTKKGQELAAKVNGGEQLTWDDLNSANWMVMSTSSSAGYIYPTLWLQANYNKSITDLAHVVTSDSYASSFARLAGGQADIIVTYADARRDYEEKWTTDLGRKASIWDETNVIGVTQGIYNDTVSVSKEDKDAKMTPEFKTALQNAFIAIAQTDAGKNVIKIYSHEGYQAAQASDYDNERKAQDLIKSLKK